MLRLVTIDLSNADMAAFERYENAVLAVAPHHGGRLELRVRSLDGRTETHLLHFPDADAFEAYRNDSARLALSADWEACGASSVVQIVERIE